MYRDIHFFVCMGCANHRWRGVITTKDTQSPQRLALFSLILLHRVGAQSLKGGLQTLTNFPRSKSQAKSLQTTLYILLGFPMNPGVTSKLDELKEDEICLGENVDRDPL
jgi:hypothetical protein